MEVQERIEGKLVLAFSVEYLEINNESDRHNVPAGSESHFRVVLVSDSFTDKLPVKRHQMVYRVLAEELEGQVHALSLHTYTPEEWVAVEQAPISPDCRGGGR